MTGRTSYLIAFKLEGGIKINKNVFMTAPESLLLTQHLSAQKYADSRDSRNTHTHIHRNIFSNSVSLPQLQKVAGLYLRQTCLGGRPLFLIGLDDPLL